MLRTVINKSSLSNNKNCGTDEWFCYPVVTPQDVRMQFATGSNFTVDKVEMFDMYGNNFIYPFAGQSLDATFSYINSSNYTGTNQKITDLQLKMFPLLNGEITSCFQLKVTLKSAGANTHYISYWSEPICIIDQQVLNVYTYNSNSIISDHIVVDGIDYPYNIFQGFGLSYSGVVSGVSTITTQANITDIKVGGVSVPFTVSTITVGQKTCSTYLMFYGMNTPNNDCNGFYYNRVQNTEISRNGAIQFQFNAYLPCGTWKELKSKLEPQKLKDSCWVSKTFITRRFKIASNQKLPIYYANKINQVVSNTFLVLGTNPILDDDVATLLMPSDQDIFQDNTHGTQVFASTIFNTCRCELSYNC